MRQRSGVLLLTLPWILVGCTGSLFKTNAPPPTLYLLTPVAAPEAVTHAAARDAAAPDAGAIHAAPSGGNAPPPGATPDTRLMTDLAVLKPRVRPGLDNDRIALVYPDRRLDYFADARWSGPLDEVVQDLAVQVFHSRAGLRNISGDASAFASNYWLELVVADFEAEYAGGPPGVAPPTVRVHFLARIGTSGERRIIARFETDVRQPATANRLSAIVDAYARAANQALLQIAGDCAAALASQPPAR
jgi:cholesterol transport system auxiliary component